MSITLYSGCLSLVRKSGVGQAILHQRDMLERIGIEATDKWTETSSAVHINTVFPDSPVAAWFARLRHRKVVYYGHSTMEDFRNSFRGSNLFAPLFKRWIIHCYELGDLVITPTPYSKRVLESYGIKRPIYALSNGVDTNFFAPSPERRIAFRNKYGLDQAEKAVISVGHYIERKGLLDFVELARALPQVRFFWFGYTNLNLVPKRIRAAIQNAPKNLSFPGYVEREELRDAYCGCDLFAFLSNEETEGIVVLEALACRIPALVRDIPVYDGWLTDGQSVYKASSPAGFAEKTAAILTGALPDLTAFGLRVARERSLDAVGEKLARIYQKENILSTVYLQENSSLAAADTMSTSTCKEGST
ncbi:MAG: glycosyltransferase [Oscillospiraceae bacterium]|nr:glycosyltransferase [Oscillospiraceae bacterium]